MWNVVELAEDHGGWSVIEEACGAEAARGLVDEQDRLRIMVPAALAALTHDEQHHKVAETLRLNQGRILRVMHGARIEKLPGVQACPNNCYCLIDNDGSHYCEVSYCDGSHCWSVRCNADC